MVQPITLVVCGSFALLLALLLPVPSQTAPPTSGQPPQISKLRLTELKTRLRQQLSDRSASKPGKFHLESLSKFSGSGRIVGGRPATSGEVPYQTSVLLLDTLLCSGTFVSATTVLTSAQCIDGLEDFIAYYSVGYGSPNLSGQTVLPVANFTVHPNYVAATLANDVALINLATAMTPGANAAIVSLATSVPAAATKVAVSGWGQLTAADETQIDALQVAPDLATVASADCNAQWGSVNPILDSMLCAQSSDTSAQAACVGDAGGPLMDRTKGVQVGVVSWGQADCAHAWPQVFANVATLNRWIAGEIGTGISGNGAATVSLGGLTLVAALAVAVVAFRF